MYVIKEVSENSEKEIKKTCRTMQLGNVLKYVDNFAIIGIIGHVKYLNVIWQVIQVCLIVYLKFEIQEFIYENLYKKMHLSMFL